MYGIMDSYPVESGPESIGVPASEIVYQPPELLDISSGEVQRLTSDVARV